MVHRVGRSVFPCVSIEKHRIYYFSTAQSVEKKDISWRFFVSTVICACIFPRVKVLGKKHFSLHLMKSLIKVLTFPNSIQESGKTFLPDDFIEPHLPLQIGQRLDFLCPNIEKPFPISAIKTHFSSKAFFLFDYPLYHLHDM